MQRRVTQHSARSGVLERLAGLVFVPVGYFHLLGLNLTSNQPDQERIKRKLKPLIFWHPHQLGPGHHEASASHQDVIDRQRPADFRSFRARWIDPANLR